jgi:hypothetical protein
MFWPGFEAGVWREGRTCNVQRDGIWGRVGVTGGVYFCRGRSADGLGRIRPRVQLGWHAGWGGQRKVVRVVQDLDAQAAWAVLVQRRAEDRAGDNEGEFHAPRTMHTADEERQTERDSGQWTVDSGRVYEML